MRHTFYCKYHDRDEPREVYAGVVSGHHYCVESIAHVRKEKTRAERESRAAEIAREDKAKAEKKRKITARVTNTSARVKVEEKLYQRELERLYSGAYDYV